MRSLIDVTILVVDDDPDMRDVVSYEIQGQGYTVVDADNASAAFEIIRSQRIDIVVTDVRMPGGDGIELLDRIGKLDSARPAVIMITGFADLTKEMALKKGAIALLPKPFDRDELKKIISDYLNNRPGSLSA